MMSLCSLRNAVYLIGWNAELIPPLIAELLVVPQVVHTVAVGTERWTLTLGVT